jgi:hypothetical protein
MLMMEELTLFLGIQVKQTKQDTFVHQVNYTKDLMKKFNMAEHKLVSTLMSMTMALDSDENGDAVDQREYMSMIDSLYLTATRPNIQFDVCLCSRFQASPCCTHQQAIQRIFRYLKYTLEFGIWYSASSLLDLVSFFDAGFAGCGIDRKSTSGTCHFLGSSLICWSSRKPTSIRQSTIQVLQVVELIEKALLLAVAPKFFG